MSTLRSVVFCGLWGLWTALFGLAIPLLWGIRSPPRLVRTLSRVWARGILVLLSSIVGLRYLERGREHVPRTPSLIVSNHQSMWETLAALVLFPDVAIVAKRELLRIPIMGWYLKRAPMIVIDRGMASKALREMTEQGRAALAAGRSVLIFPEGTRKLRAEPIKFKRGVELLYRRLGVPVLPVVVNSGRLWGIGSAPKQPGTIIVSFLAPIKPGLSAADFSSTAEALMEAEKTKLERGEEESSSAVGCRPNLAAFGPLEWALMILRFKRR